MIITLNTGPPSAPRIAIFDTTGISIVPEKAPTYCGARPHMAEITMPGGRKTSIARPRTSESMFAERGLLAGRYAEVLAEWEAALAVAVEKWEAVRAGWEAENYRQAAVWHGPRFVMDHEGNNHDLATFVHESPEEIAIGLRVSAAGGAL